MKKRLCKVIKGSTSTYSAEILNSFNSELQFKDTQFAIKNKLIYLLSELKGFKFITTLFFEFKIKKLMTKQNMASFIQTQKQEQLLMKVILMMFLNQFILRLYQTYKNLQEKIQVGLLTQSQIMILIFQSKIAYLKNFLKKLPKELRHPKKGLISI